MKNYGHTLPGVYGAELASNSDLHDVLCRQNPHYADYAESAFTLLDQREITGRDHDSIISGLDSTLAR